MSGGTDVAEGKLMEVPDRAGAAFGGLEESAIADGLQDGETLAIQLFKAQRFIVTGLVADGEATVASELGEILEAIGVLDKGDEEMSADDADAWGGGQMSDFREGAAGLNHEAAGLMLSLEGLIHEAKEQEGLWPE